MTAPVPRDIVLNLIRAKTGTYVDPEKYDISVPEVLTEGPYNTRLTFIPKLSGKRYATQNFRYNRIDVSGMSITVDRGSAVLMSDLLEKISRSGKLGIAVDTSTDPLISDISLLAMVAEDIVDDSIPAQVGNSPTTTATLHTHMNSLIFQGSVDITINNITVPQPVFSLTSTPEVADTTGPIVLSGRLTGLSPSTSYKLRLYRQNSGTPGAYDGVLVASLANRTTDVNGEFTYRDVIDSENNPQDSYLFVAVYPTSEVGPFTNSVDVTPLRNSEFARYVVAYAVDPTFYATWRPGSKNSVVTNNRLTAGGLTAYNSVKATIGVSSGKWYWELKASNPGVIGGVARITELLNLYVGSGPYGWGAGGAANQARWNNAIKTIFANSWKRFSIVGMYLDMDAGTLGLIIDNVDIGVVFHGITGTVYPAVSGATALTEIAVTANFGASAFEGTPPGGYNLGIYDPTFTPYQMPGLQAWFDADDDETIIEVGGKVAQWNDKSGHRRHAVQETAANRYVRTPASVNGRFAMVNSGASCFMTFPDLALKGHEKALFVVMANTGETVGVGNNLADNYWYLQLSADTVGSIISGRGTGNEYVTNLGVGASDGSPHVLAHNERGGYVRMSYDAAGNSDTSFTDSIVNTLTSNGVAGKYLSGKLCEVIIGDVPLTANDTLRIKNYLKAKWGTP